MGKIISGKDLAASLKAKMSEDIIQYVNKYGRRPKLAVILVGEDPGSVSYVAGKEKACIQIGIENLTIRKPATITQEELLKMIDNLNKDDSVDGILVQLPLPKHIDENCREERRTRQASEITGDAH